MQIREMNVEDIEELAELYKQFWDEESKVKKMRNKFAELKNNDHYIYLSAVKDEKLVGSMLGIICKSLYGECAPFLVIEDFIVDKDYRQQGVGSALMEEMEDYAAKRDCTHILLVTERERKGAIKFYESCGFQKGTHQGFKKKIENSYHP